MPLQKCNAGTYVWSSMGVRLKGLERPDLFFSFHEPDALFQPQIGLAAIDPAGVSVADAAHPLAGGPADVQHSVHMEQKSLFSS